MDSKGLEVVTQLFRVCIIRGKVEKPVHDIIEVQEKTPTKGRSILVIDDDAALLELNKTILEMEGYDVFIALSGAEALSLLEKIAPPDLILLDMRMEDMSGPEFLLTLEKNRSDIIESVPVVFVTGLEKVPASKAIGFIRKPYDIDTLLEAVHRFIEMGASSLLKHKD